MRCAILSLDRPPDSVEEKSIMAEAEDAIRKPAYREVGETDCFTPEKRSEVMSRVRSENTSPEIKVRRTLHRMGYRFRLHRRDLPGSPDVVLPKHRIALFVHGCFWHRHPGCRRATVPKKNSEFWVAKLERNTQRDEQAQRELRELGWNVVVIWECEVPRRTELLEARLEELLHRAAGCGNV